MPSFQVVDTTVNQTPNRAEENLKTFFSKMGKDYKDKQDKVEIGNLLDQYQQNRQDANAWEDLQIGLEKSNISPTKRLETQKSLNEIQKNVIEKDKVLNAQTKALQDEAKKKQSEEEKRIKDEKVIEEKRIKEEKKIIEAQEKASKTASEVKEILRQDPDLDEEEIERLSTILTPSSASARIKNKKAVKKVEDKKTEKKQEEEKAQKITQNAFNDIVKLVPKAGRGTGVLSVFGGENAKTLGEFTSLTGALESLLVEKVNRGALSNTRFQYITQTLLPKATDSQNEIKGKLKGLATILELDPSELDKLEEKPKEKKSKKSNVPEGKVRVKNKQTGQVGTVTPYPGMETKYDTIE